MLRNAQGELLGVGPGRQRRDGQHHVQPFAAGRFQKALEVIFGQQIAELLRGGGNLPPGDAGTGIEIEDD